MSDPATPLGAPMPAARVERRHPFSAIWIIPAVTLLIAAWLAWNTLSQRGPLITITFQSAEGLQAGQSQIRHKDVTMGTVQSIVLSPDLGHVIVTARMNREAERLLTDRARFWVVKPRLFAGNISGFETILSGSYIELLPAAAGSRAERHFTGLEDPPVLQSDIPGRTFLLKADRLGSLNLGSPIFYRDLSVGTVLGWDIGQMAKSVTVHAFVRAPFDQYVRDQSRFWNASGASVSLGATGIRFNVESLRALLLGGIAFDTPEDAESSPLAGQNRAFTLYASEDAANSAQFRHTPLVAYFPGSVAGLAVGAPVTLLGIRIGEVTSIDLRYDPARDAVVVPVHFDVQPERIADIGQVEKRGPLTNIRALVARGMRAQLETANLLTGQKEIALVVLPDAPPATVRTEGSAFVVPTAPGQFAGIAESAAALLDKINRMPFAKIGDNLNATLVGLNGIANGRALHDSLAGLQTTLAAVRDVVQKLDRGASPALDQLPGIARDLQALLGRTSTLVLSADAGYGGNSKFYRDLDRLLVQMNDVMQSVQALSDLLTRHPEALIRGRPAGEPTQ